MQKICPASNQKTYCTEHCKDCAKEIYNDLKAKAGNVEIVTEEAIRNDLGNEAFDMLHYYGFIEHCRVDELGRHWYAI